LQFPLLLDMLQATSQKIDFQRLPTHLPFQFGYLAFVGTPLSVACERSAAEIIQLLAPPVQNIGIHLAGPCHFGQRHSQGKPPDCLFLKLLNSFVNFRRTAPMTQFSIQ
jgi:hypothetical protein